MEANDDMDLNLHDAAWTSEAGLDATNPHFFKQCLYLTGLCGLPYMDRFVLDHGSFRRVPRNPLTTLCVACCLPRTYSPASGNQLF